DGVVWVTIGEDTAGPELAERLTDIVEFLGGGRPGLTDPLLAGAELGRVLRDRRVLLVVDDVWTSAQVKPFLVDGSSAVRLFTTRVRGVLPLSAELVRVDEMTRGEAVQLLTAGVGGTSGDVVMGLLAVTGRWPVLLALVNHAVRVDVNAGRSADDSMREILHELRMNGPTVLDVTNADEREEAVARTIGVSLARLTAEERSRYLELAVFGEDVAIPGAVLAHYWEATGGWSAFETRRFCQRLSALALVSDYRYDPEWMVLHDVIRAYLCARTRHRRGELHRALVDAHRSIVAGEGRTAAWWQLPREQTYLWEWLPTHLQGAGLKHELRACLHDPRWLVGKLEHVGPAGLEVDLALSDDPLCQALQKVVRQNAHVLGPLEPPGSLGATFATRVPAHGRTKAFAEELVAGLSMPHLRPVTVTALSDLPHPALSRVLRADGVDVLAVAPDGSWLAAADSEGKVWIWDRVMAVGVVRHTLTEHSSTVAALAVAPDGSWLASAGYDTQVWLWDPVTGTARYTLTGHTSTVTALAVASDGSWLASADDQGRVCIWDPILGSARYCFAGHASEVTALAVAPDRSWLASADCEGRIRVWDPIAGRNLCTIATDKGEVGALAVAPDGSWLASGHREGEVCIWDPVTGAIRHTFVDGHYKQVDELVVALNGAWLASADAGGRVCVWDPADRSTRAAFRSARGTSLVVAPDGSWLACGGYDGEVDIWDPLTPSFGQRLTGHRVDALAVAPDGSWLASADGGHGGVWIWDLATDEDRVDLTDPLGRVNKLAVAPDGTWLACGHGDAGLWIWDPATGGIRCMLTYARPTWSALAVAPDGSWLASGHSDGEVRIWDPATGVARHTLTNQTSPIEALAVAPDGSWLACADGNWGEVLHIWDLASGRVRHTLTGHTRRVMALAVAPDGSWLASADHNGEIRVWDLATGTVRHTLTGHTKTVDALAVAPDGSWLASSGFDRQVVIWDSVTGAARHALTGRTGWLGIFAVAPDGTWLACAGDNEGEIQVLNPVTGTLYHTLTGHTEWVVALAIAPDGSWLASADNGGEIRIWDPTNGAPVTSLRVADRLNYLVMASTKIVAAGERDHPYFLTLCPGTQSTQAP
ncbi:MAG TPA: hypothetical protein VFO16_00815, partial [Pseudonocardiaceae bacterium]|nr:hypothetical protein [Pseudonocardiaceae bacterium]